MLKIGIIGAGRIGKVHLESISYHVKGAEVVAIADPFMNRDMAAWIHSMDSSIEVTKDYKEILADEEIDKLALVSKDIKINTIKNYEVICK